MRGRLAGIGIALTIVIPALAQSHYTPPRTPWGDPDLQGHWPGNMGVPMQRPVDFGDRIQLTDVEFARREAQAAAQAKAEDRKSTRLNSSHLGISYAVFCLKKKNNKKIRA